MALVPEVVERLVGGGVSVTVERGAGESAHQPDDAYERAGASLGDGWSGEVVAKVAPPSTEEVGRLLGMPGANVMQYDGVRTATVVGAFLTGWPSIIAVILNYVKRSEARGTWLESHFRWQIRTFWFGLLWVSLCMLFVVLTLGVGILIAWVPLGIVGLWFIYRIARGWLALLDHRPMYVTP